MVYELSDWSMVAKQLVQPVLRGYRQDEISWKFNHSWNQSIVIRDNNVVGQSRHGGPPHQ